MTSDPPEVAYLKTIWRELNLNVDASMRFVTHGHGLRVPDPPKPKHMAEAGVTAARKLFADKVRSLGLHQDKEFVESLQALLRETATMPVWGLLTALDGEGAWEDEAWYELHRDGARVDAGLHDAFWDYAEPGWRG